jgi:hypothetical protein
MKTATATAAAKPAKTRKKQAAKKTAVAKVPKQPKAKKVEPTPAPAPESSKKDQVLALLRRPTGATLGEIIAATCWQKHTVRGFIAGSVSKKMGLCVESKKNDAGERAYRIA